MDIKNEGKGDLLALWIPRSGSNHRTKKAKQLYLLPGRPQLTGSSAPPSNAALALRQPTLFCLSQNRVGQHSSFSQPQPSTPAPLSAAISGIPREI